MSNVICDQSNNCYESKQCGGSKPHPYHQEECGKCPVNLEAKCVEVNARDFILSSGIKIP